MSTITRTILLLSLWATQSAFSQSDTILGDYTGWSYQQDGGDFPLRAQLVDKAGKTVLWLSMPAHRTWGQPTANLKLDGKTLTFERTNSQGKLWSYRAEIAGGTITGDATLEGDGEKFAFELHRSAEPLVSGKLAKHESYLGTYGGGSNSAIVISAWFWGELRYFDIESGRSGTLFETAKGDFIVGPAEYVPAPVFARIRFLRGGDASVTGLAWSPTGGAERQLARAGRIEEEIAFQNGAVSLSGTLIKPATPGPHPAIVVLGGSGWRDRSGTRSEGDLFVAQGLAAFVYDQRGYGKSTGDKICSFEDTASDAAAAAAMLRTREDIDPARIGMSGRSRGGWLAPLAASQSSNVNFLVLFVPPAVSPADQETTRRLNAMRAEGFSTQEIETASKYLELQMRATKSDADWDSYAHASDEIKTRPWFEIVGHHESRDSDDYRWCKLNMNYDPIPALERVRCPVLALFGERDDNVTVEPNVRLMESALQRGGNNEVTMKVIPTGDHGLRPVATTGTQTPLHKAVGTVPGVWSGIGEWLHTKKIVQP